MNFDGLKGKTALIIGGGSGIAKETAKQFAFNGTNVMIADLNGRNAESAAQEIKAAGGNAVFVQTNITNVDEIKNMVQKTVESFGSLDIAVNAATARPDFTNLENFDIDKYDMNMNVDLKSVLLSMKYETEQMVKQEKGGAICNVSSAGVELNGFTMYGYNLAKVGVRKATRMAADEFGSKGIRINMISPGSTATPLAENIVEDMKKAGMQFSLETSASFSLLGRNALPLDQANAILFLCSDQASFITGQNINVDGGMTVK